jgi:hypothetical protein
LLLVPQESDMPLAQSGPDDEHACPSVAAFRHRGVAPVPSQ